jgi:hypothetical protein
VGFFTTNPTKLCLHFSDFFYDFLRNLQESAKALYYLRSAFTTRPLTGFPDLRTGPWFTKIFLERMGSPQLGPRAPAAPAGVSAGGAGERRRSSPLLDLGPRKGRGGFRRRRSAAPGGSGRWSCSSDEVGAGATDWNLHESCVPQQAGQLSYW